jgi:phosphohistidine phosphatase
MSPLFDYVCFMKMLYIVRHAKSDWSHPEQIDFERTLNDRGLLNAPFMAEKFASRHGHVDRIVSSPANRAITTAGYFAEALKIGKEAIVQDKNIYEAGLNQLINVVCGFNERDNKVMLFGHNPGLSILLAYLTGNGMSMPTCAIAEVELHVDSWKLINSETCSLKFFDYPKRYV